MQKFLETYQFSQDPTDFVLSSELREYVTKTFSDSVLTYGKFCVEIKQYVRENCLENVDNKKVKKIGGVQHRAWWGIRLTMELPTYDNLIDKCKEINSTVVTTKEQYFAGTEKEGVYFCPRHHYFSNLNRNIMNSKPIDTLMREWQAERDAGRD